MTRCVWLGLAVLLAGCGGGPARPAAVPAKGKVSLKGQPVGGALVVFHPKAPGREQAEKPFATTKDDGTFALTVYEEGDGAPEGDYGVTVVWNKAAKAAKMSLGGEGGGGTDQLGGRYADPRNPKLTATVKKGGPNEFAFELQ